MKARTWMGVAAALAMVAGGGCKDTFTPAWLVQRARVLGARVEVQGDPTRASPAPGETANVTWPMAYPDVAPPLTWAFAWCPEAPILFGPPLCASNAAPTLVTPQQTPVTGTTPSVSFTVPDAQQLQDVTSIVVMGVICVNGTVSIDPSLLTDPSALNDVCQGANAQPLLVEDSIPLALNGLSNLNPAIYDIEIGGAYGSPWPDPPAAALDAPQQGCPFPTLSNFYAGSSPYQIRIEVPLASREMYQSTDANGAPVTLTEQMVVAHLATAGTMDSLFSFIDQDGQTIVATTWTPPKAADLAYDPELVRFYFVVSDQRGGETFATKAACVESQP